MVMSSPRITYAPRDDTSTAVEVAALANLYAFVIRRSQVKKKAGGMTSANGSMLRDTQEVSDVEQRPD